MSSSDLLQSGNPPSIVVFFERPAITSLFSQLLWSRGVATAKVKDLSQLDDPSSLVITEPQYFNRLSRELQRRALVVGERNDVRRLSTLYLDTPLTEEKIDRALSAFLTPLE